MARANLAAVRQRVERLAASMASADPIWTWTDERLAAELRAVLARVNPCSGCGHDLASYARAAIDNGSGAEVVFPALCPSCGARV